MRVSYGPVNGPTDGVLGGVELNGGRLSQLRVGDLLALEGLAVDHPTYALQDQVSVVRWSYVAVVVLDHADGCAHLRATPVTRTDTAFSGGVRCPCRDAVASDQPLRPICGSLRLSKPFSM